MRYFQIYSDKKNPQPQFLNWYRVLKPVRWEDSQVYKVIKNKSCFPVELEKEAEFLDVICHPQFMVSNEFAQLIHIYDSKIPFKNIVLSDAKSRRSVTYQLPNLPEIDCLSEESVLNQDRSVIMNGMLQREKIVHNPIFQLGNINGRYIIASLEFVESAYRRRVTGMNTREFKVT